MNLLVLSDLHIRDGADPMYFSLLRLIKNVAQPGDVLLLAGDIFELFVGNKKIFRDRYSEFLTTLQDAGQRGVKTHYLEGNHDFFIKGAFSKIEGCRVHPSHAVIELAGKRIYVAHGDFIDKTDYHYRFLRAFFRCPLMRLFIAAAPGRWIDTIGRYSSRQSKKGRVYTNRLQKPFRNFAVEHLAKGCDFVILGHSHEADEMSFRIGDHEGHYLNTGTPRNHQSYFVWCPQNESFERKPMP